MWLPCTVFDFFNFEVWNMSSKIRVFILSGDASIRPHLRRFGCDAQFLIEHGTYGQFNDFITHDRESYAQKAIDYVHDNNDPMGLRQRETRLPVDHLTLFEGLLS